MNIHEEPCQERPETRRVTRGAVSGPETRRVTRGAVLGAARDEAREALLPPRPLCRGRILCANWGEGSLL